ncbi:hypothetical protein R6Q59_027210 [Mikania micrantha]
MVLLGCNVICHVGVLLLHFKKRGCNGIGTWGINSVLNAAILMLFLSFYVNSHLRGRWKASPDRRDEVAGKAVTGMSQLSQSLVIIFLLFYPLPEPHFTFFHVLAVHIHRLQQSDYRLDSDTRPVLYLGILASYGFHSFRLTSDSDYYESEHHETFSSINSTPENSMISSGLYGCVEYPMLDYDQMLDRSAVYSESRNINTLDDVCRWLCDDVDDDQELE